MPLAWILLVLLLTSSANATPENDLGVYQQLYEMQEAVFREPVASSQRLDALQPESEKDPATQLLWLLRRVQAYHYSYQFDLFEQTLATALEKLNGDSDAEVRGYLMMYQGIALHHKGEYQKSIAALKKSINIAAARNLKFLQVMALSELVYAYSLAEEYEQAMLQLNTAYQLVNQMQNPFLSGLVEESHAALLGYQDDNQQSLERYRIALEYYSQLGYPYFIGEATFGIASTYRYDKQWDNAIKYFEAYNQVVKDFSDVYPYFFYHYGLGMTYAESGNCKKALGSITKILSVPQFKDYKAELYKRMAICMGKLKDFVAAKAALDQSRVIYAELPELQGTSWELETIKIESQLETMKGKYRHAYQLLEKYYEDYLEVDHRNNARRLDELRVKVQSERKQMESTLSEQKALNQQLALKDRNRQIEIQQLWIKISLAFIVLGVLALIWQWRVSKKFKWVSLTDELTGLTNRRFIFQSIESALKRDANDKTFHSLMLIDLDNLKTINDRYGHQMGDKLICAVANAGRQSLRGGDIFSRIGGDEYLLFLTRSSPEVEQKVIKRINERLATTELRSNDGERLWTSVSIGILSVRDHNDSVEVLFSRVDNALYQAKRQGRNQAVHWQG